MSGCERCGDPGHCACWHGACCSCGSKDHGSCGVHPLVEPAVEHHDDGWCQVCAMVTVAGAMQGEEQR